MYPSVFMSISGTARSSASPTPEYNCVLTMLQCPACILLMQSKRLSHSCSGRQSSAPHFRRHLVASVHRSATAVTAFRCRPPLTYGAGRRGWGWGVSGRHPWRDLGDLSWSSDQGAATGDTAPVRRPEAVQLRTGMLSSWGRQASVVLEESPFSPVAIPWNRLLPSHRAVCCHPIEPSVAVPWSRPLPFHGAAC